MTLQMYSWHIFDKSRNFQSHFNDWKCWFLCHECLLYPMYLAVVFCHMSKKWWFLFSFIVFYFLPFVFFLVDDFWWSFICFISFGCILALWCNVWINVNDCVFWVKVNVFGHPIKCHFKIQCNHFTIILKLIQLQHRIIFHKYHEYYHVLSMVSTV